MFQGSRNMKALFIGRFQPYHKGHHHAIQQALDEHELVIGVGSSGKEGTRENPLSYGERKQVLENCLGDMDIVPLEDQDDNDRWLDLVEEKIDFQLAISGNRLVQRLLQGRGYEVRDPDYLKPGEYSGTEVRRRLREGEEWKDFVPGCSLELLERFGFEERVQKEG